MDEAAQADRLLVMSQGQILMDGPPRELFRRVDEMRAIGLAVPESAALLYELRESGLDIPPDATTDEDCIRILSGLFALQTPAGNEG